MGIIGMSVSIIDNAEFLTFPCSLSRLGYTLTLLDGDIYIDIKESPFSLLSPYAIVLDKSPKKHYASAAEESSG